MTDFLAAVGLVFVIEGLVFAAFPGPAKRSMAAVMAINSGAVLSEVHEALEPLKPVAAANDDAANDAWHARWMMLGERSERLADEDDAPDAGSAPAPNTNARRSTT